MIRLSGFTFVRNAVQFDYPVIESISSILPIVDEFIVNVGPDDDGTLDLIHSIRDPKIKIIRSQWNPHVKKGGYIYAQQTNIALFNCSGKWAFYLQADEVVHEDDLPLLVEYMDRYQDDNRIEGLILHELFFWGDYKVIFDIYPFGRRRRCRIIKPHQFVLSRGDASGFTVHPKYKERGRRISVIDTGVRLFHYGTIKSLKALKNKNTAVSKYWGAEQPVDWGESVYSQFPSQFFKYFTGSHPCVMKERISNHPFSIDLSSNKWKKISWTDRLYILKTFFVDHISSSFSGRGSYKLIRK